MVIHFRGDAVVEVQFYAGKTVTWSDSLFVD